MSRSYGSMPNINGHTKSDKVDPIIDHHPESPKLTDVTRSHVETKGWEDGAPPKNTDQTLPHRDGSEGAILPALEKLEKGASVVPRGTILLGFMKEAKAVAEKTNPALWESAKSEAKSKMGGKHSARAMQLATNIYKKKGGGYKGKKQSSGNKLKKWGDEKWQPNPSGKRPNKNIAKDSKGRTTRYLPQKAWDNLSPSERRATDTKKKKAKTQFVANTSKARAAGQSARSKTASILDGFMKAAKSEFHTNKPLYQPRPSTRAGKKYMVYVKSPGGAGKRLIHFGATGYKHNYSEAAKKNFRARHNCDGAQKDTAKWWACNYLWNKKQDIGNKTYDKVASVEKGQPHMVPVKMDEDRWDISFKDGDGKTRKSVSGTEKEMLKVLTECRAKGTTDFLDDGCRYALNDKGLSKIAALIILEL